jgi:hypothetical protein
VLQFMLAPKIEDIQRLDGVYSYRDRGEVLRFLEKYSFLVPLLLQAPGKISDHFPDPRLTLEVMADPEAVKDRQLLLSIATELSADDAAQRLDRLDESWWLDAVGRAQGKLCIIVEFQ